jgi:hypothetical protein
VDKLIQNKRVIALHNSSPISLAPSIFREMLKFPEPNLVYKGEEARKFLKRNTNGLEPLQEYFHDPTTMLEDISRIQVSSLKNPYKEIVSLFTRIASEDSTETLPRLSLYKLHFVVHENVIFGWAKIISNEITSQLTNFKSDKRFYMSSYLIFSLHIVILLRA